MSEKAHLKFNQFQNFLGQAQVKMMNNEFCDITLVSGDNKKIEAHRVILSASSAFFKNILAGEKHANPLIFMRGVYSEDLEALIEFICCGETKLLKEQVDSFVKLITDIELFGVTEEAINEERFKKKQRNSKEKSVCKHWNSGFCKNDKCLDLHYQQDCEYHLSGI